MQTTENDAAKLAARSYREGFNAMKLKALELLGNTCLHCENADWSRANFAPRTEPSPR